MKKEFLILTISILLSINIFGQVNINKHGMVDIRTKTLKNQIALRVSIPNSSCYSYNLYNEDLNKDVFYVYGDGGVTSVKGFYTSSDLSLKTNISKIDNPLLKVSKLNGVKFNYKEDFNFDNANNYNNNNKCNITNKLPKDYIGVIAQDVEKVFPELVIELENGTKAVNYGALSAVLIEAVKEQQIIIEQLKDQLNNDKDKIASLNNDINYLKEELDLIKAIFKFDNVTSNYQETINN